MKTYTMKDWEKDGELRPSIGQAIDFEIFLDLRDCVPPAFLTRDIFQVGEAYDHDRERNKPLYTTFKKNDKGEWTYKGICLLGQTDDRTQYSYGYASRLFDTYR